MAPFSPCFLLTFLAVKGNGDLLPMLFLPTWVVWYRHHQDISRCWPLSFSLPSIIHGIPLSRRTQKRPAAAASLKGGPCVIVTKMLEILRLRLHLLLRIDLDKTCPPVGAEKMGMFASHVYLHVGCLFIAKSIRLLLSRRTFDPRICI